MKKIAKILMSSLLLAGACGQGDESAAEEKTADQETSGEPGKAADEGYTLDVKTIQADYFDSPFYQAAYWEILAFNTTFSYDDEGNKTAADKSYDGLDFWMDTYYGAAYPFNPGTYVLGDSEAERNYLTCTKCLVLGTGMTPNSLGKEHIAVAGSVVIEEFSAGKLRATFKDLELREFTEVTGLNDNGIEVVKEAPLVENGETIYIKELVINSDSSTDVYVPDCDNATAALDMYGCASALGAAFPPQK